jgi:sulfatase maturation enzyme AslB (radical SAM superfamily)
MSFSNAVQMEPSTSERFAPWLDFLWLEVTAKCNLRCVHCYTESGPQRRLHEHMSPEGWEDALDQAATLGCRAVQFIGGEPTMYPALPALIERARALGFDTVEVYTNGTMFKPRIKDAFLRHKVDLAFSVYAADAETHDRVTQQSGSFECTLASIQWALESGFSVRAGIIEMDENAGHACRAKEKLQEIGVKNIGIDRARGVGRGVNKTLQASQFHELCGACWRGKLAITATGQIFPCVFSRFCPVGHVDQGLKAVLEGIPLHAFRHRMKHERARPISACDPDSTHCTPQECQPLVGCRPDQVCQPDICRPSGCLPSECNPQSCNPPIHCRPDAN